MGGGGGGNGGDGGGGGALGTAGGSGGGGGAGGAMTHRSIVSSIISPVERSCVSTMALHRWPSQHAKASEHLAASGVHGGGGCGEGGLIKGGGGGLGGAGGGGGRGSGGGGPVAATNGGGKSTVPTELAPKLSGTESSSESLGCDLTKKSSSTAAIATRAVHLRHPTVVRPLGSTAATLSSSSSLCAADGTGVGPTGTNTAFGITLGSGVGLGAPPAGGRGGGSRRQPLKVRPSSAMGHPT